MRPRTSCFIMYLALFLAFAASANAAAPEVQWSSVVGGADSDRGFAVDIAHGGGYVVAGETSSDGAAYIDILLAKLDEEGEVVWQTSIGGAAEDVCNSVARTSDGGYVLAGYTGVRPLSIDYYLVKVDGEGGVQWSRTFGGSGVEECTAVIEAEDGGYVLAGDGPDGIYLVKTDANGDLDWEQSYADPKDHCYSLVQTADGGYALVGWRSDGSLVPEHDMMLLKVSSAGAFQWKRLYDIGVEDRGFEILQLENRDYVVAGSIGNFSLWKLSPSGVLRWQHDYGTPVNDICLAMDVAPDGGYLLGGYTYDYDAGFEMYAVRTDADGVALWEETYGGPLYDYGWDLTASDDGGWLLVGTTQSYGSGGNDLYALKLGPDSSGTGVGEGVVDGSRVQLSRPEPNPFAGETKLAFSLESGAEVELHIYDVSGRRVRTLWSGFAGEGRHEVSFDGRADGGHRLVSGVYFCRLETTGEVLTRKLLRLR